MWEGRGGIGAMAGFGAAAFLVHGLQCTFVAGSLRIRSGPNDWYWRFQDSSHRTITVRFLPIGEEKDNTSYSMERDKIHASLPTFPDIMAGRRQGRINDEQISSFFNNGMGYQFAAAGYLINKKAREAGIGRELPTDWFTETVHP